MEITNDIKSRVFAQYLGQRALTNKMSYKKPSIGIFTSIDLEGEETVITKDGYYLSGVNTTQLILKPLSSVTDEHSIEVAKILGCNEDVSIYDKTKDRIIIHSSEGSFSLWYDGEILSPIDSVLGQGDGYPTLLAAYQFLQYKGYDLPQYLLGGKTLKESGLAIYEDDLK